MGIKEKFLPGKEIKNKEEKERLLQFFREWIKEKGVEEGGFVEIDMEYYFIGEVNRDDGILRLKKIDGSNIRDISFEEFGEHVIWQIRVVDKREVKPGYNEIREIDEEISKLKEKKKAIFAKYENLERIESLYQQDIEFEKRKNKNQIK